MFMTDHERFNRNICLFFISCGIKFMEVAAWAVLEDG